MAKQTTAKTKPTDKTKLVMKAKKTYCQKGNVSVDFKPAKKDQLYKNFKDIALFPTFNKDKKYYTPTFVLRFFDKLESSEELKSQHEKKVVEYTTEIDCDNIMFPKPRSKNQYCGVCKDNYEDYYTHIHQEQHRQQSRTSRFTKYINQLSIKFNPHLYKQQKQQIEHQLHELMVKYKSQDHNYSNGGTSYETTPNKSKKKHNPDLKKDSSFTNSNNRANTIILSSD